MLFKSPKLTDQELRVIGAIASMYRTLRYALLNPSRWEGVLRRNTFARAIRGSNSIEGYLVTAEDAMAAAEGEEPMDAQSETWYAVMGYRNAMTYVLQLCKDPDFHLSEGFLRSFHFMMLQHDLSKHPGNWRPGPIFVRDELKGQNVYEGPQASLVPSLMTDLLSYVNGQDDANHALIKAAMIHLNLVMIHPFSDGNGRMGRCLHTLAMASKAIVDPTLSSIEEYLGRNTQEYYAVLAQVGKGSWNPQNDTRYWIRFNLKAHYTQAATVLRRSRVTSKIWGELEREIKDTQLPDRVIYALFDAAMGYRVRSVHYRHSAELSPVSASRDLQLLVKTGLLTSVGEKRGRVYTASEKIQAIARKIRSGEPREIPDPFQSKQLITG
jgi:Fic family protein